MLDALFVFIAFALALAAARLHAWPGSWIQGLNYLVAAFPLAQTAIHLHRFQTTQNQKSRRLLAWYFAMFVGISLYAWRDVEIHHAELRAREAELAAEIAAKEAEGETDFTVAFRHSMNRNHVYRSTTRSWTDEAVGD